MVRAPNHLGDVVMALGVLQELDADVVVAASLVPLLSMGGVGGRILPFRRSAAGWFRTLEFLRAERYQEGLLLSGAFSAALLFRLAGVSRIRGMDSDGRRLLLTDPIPMDRLRGNHRVNNFRMMAGLPPLDPLRPAPIAPPLVEVERWRDILGGGEPRVALFPGANAPARRWNPDRFAAVARALAREGVRVLVLGGPGERRLTARVAGDTPGVEDLGGRTDLTGLAAVLSLVRLLVTNDTGPMHLAAAVGTPTLTLWGSSDPAEVHPLGAEDRRVQAPSLPCAPCKKNHCPRSGIGTRLPSARNECMELIATEVVLAAVREVMAGGRPA